MRFNIGKAGIGGAFANRILRGIVRLVEVDFKADDTGQAPVLEVGRIDKVDALSYVKAVIYLVFVYPDGVERSRIGAVVDAGLCHVLLCSGKQFLFGSSHQPRLNGRRELIYALLLGASTGFYDGFFGPGAGSFYALAFVTLAGFNLAKSTAHAKVLNATSNVGGLLLFIIGGKVIWATGFVMMAGQFLGARAGSRLVLSKGQKLIRPMIVIVSAVMSAKLLYDSHGQEILHWLGMN